MAEKDYVTRIITTRCCNRQFRFRSICFIFALLYVINGIGRSLYIPAQRAQIADLTKQEQQAEIFALLQTMGAIGSVVGPLIGACFIILTQNIYLSCKV